MRALLIAWAMVACACARASDSDHPSAQAAKGDVQVALFAVDGGKARVVVTNRNPWAVTAAFTIAFSLNGEPQPFSATIPPRGVAGAGDAFPVAGSLTLAEIRIGVVDKSDIGAATGYAKQAERNKDGVTITAWATPTQPDRWYLVVQNDNHYDIRASWLWNYDAIPVVATQRVNGNGKAGQHGEIMQMIRQSDDDREQTREPFSISAVVPVP